MIFRYFFFASYIAGEIKMDSFVNSLTTVDISWSGFESNLDLFFYFVGITNSTEAAARLDCEEVLLVSCMMLKNCDLNHVVFCSHS